MYTFTVHIDIAVPAARVWSALCDPAQVVLWDTGVAAALDAPPDYPQPGQHVRWRYRNGPFRTLHDRPQEVVLERTLRARLSVGPFRFDETYTLEPAAGVGAADPACVPTRTPEASGGREPSADTPLPARTPEASTLRRGSGTQEASGGDGPEDGSGGRDGSLRATKSDAPAGITRLSAAMQVWSPGGPVGRLIEHRYLGPRTKAAVTASLEAIKMHCERRVA